MNCPHCERFIHECDPRDLEDVAFRRSMQALRGKRSVHVSVSLSPSRVTRTTTIVRRYGGNAIAGPPTNPPRGVS